jgi:hypothetical protein
LTAPLPEAAQRNVGDNPTPVRTSPMMEIVVDRFVGDRRGPRQVQLALGVLPDIAIKYNAAAYSTGTARRPMSIAISPILLLSLCSIKAASFCTHSSSLKSTRSMEPCGSAFDCIA